jgi:hypothetical protein
MLLQPLLKIGFFDPHIPPDLDVRDISPLHQDLELGFAHLQIIRHFGNGHHIFHANSFQQIRYNDPTTIGVLRLPGDPQPIFFALLPGMAQVDLQNSGLETPGPHNGKMDLFSPPSSIGTPANARSPGSPQSKSFNPPYPLPTLPWLPPQTIRGGNVATWDGSLDDEHKPGILASYQ